MAPNSFIVDIRLGFKNISEKYPVKEISTYANTCCTSCIISLFNTRYNLAKTNLLERNQFTWVQTAKSDVQPFSVESQKTIIPKVIKQAQNCKLIILMYLFPFICRYVAHLNKFYSRFFATSPPTFTFWKSAIETIEKGVKYVQS